jgi:hypothetical protein
MNDITGVVEEVYNNGVGKGSGVVIAGQKYGAYDPHKAGIASLSPGDTITFKYDARGKYLNIKGRVETASGGHTPPPPPPPAPKTRGRGFGTFPIGALDGQRSIVRQNSVTNAVNTFGHLVSAGAWSELSDDDFRSYAQKIIQIAKMFEAYSSGDLDEEEAEQAMRELSECGAE